MSSEEYKNELQEKLEELIETLDYTYYSMKRELSKEIQSVADVKKQSNILADKIYDSLDFDLCTKLVKSKLPLRIKLLNKITCNGKSLHDEYITINYYFNEDVSFKWSYDFYIDEIIDMLKIKTNESNILQ
jgi:hypothetical protein